MNKILVTLALTLCGTLGQGQQTPPWPNMSFAPPPQTLTLEDTFDSLCAHVTDPEKGLDGWIYFGDDGAFGKSTVSCYDAIVQWNNRVTSVPPPYIRRSRV